MLIISSYPCVCCVLDGTKGERHGDAAERMLAAQRKTNSVSSMQLDRMFPGENIRANSAAMFRAPPVPQFPTSTPMALGRPSIPPLPAQNPFANATIARPSVPPQVINASMESCCPVSKILGEA